MADMINEQVQNTEVVYDDAALAAEYMAKRQAPAQPFTASAELTSQCQMFKAGNSQVAFGVFTQAGSKLAQEEAVQEEQSAE